MSLRRSRLAGLLVSVGVLAAALVAWVAVDVDRATVPRREAQVLPDFESMRIRVSEVEFPSTDGIRLSGWWMAGDADMPAVVLCHDLGSSKRAMINVAIALHDDGFDVLMFDFRGHGTSAGKRSSFGVLEKRDVIGALDWLPRKDAAGVGLFGAGMGAHAAVLAAAERPEVRVLVLDGLYPDAAYRLARDVLIPSPSWARRGVGLLSNGIFTALNGTSPLSERALDTVGELTGIHLLLLAPASDSELLAAMREMVQRVPDQIEADGNLVVVPATLGEGLYGEQLNRYHKHVSGFFASRLVRAEGELVAGW
jgi:pimeloyl-ACP methyl ester carboxylesterase